MRLTHKAGFSLTEMMLALFLGSLIFSLMIANYLSQKNLYQAQQSLTEEQEHARVAIQILKNAIQHAGFMGCMKSNENNLQILHQAPNSLKGRAFAGSDILEVKNIDTELNYLIQDMAQANTLRSNRKNIFKPGQSVLLSTCSHAEEVIVDSVKQFSNISQQRITFHPNTKYLYSHDAVAAPLLMERYFVAKTKRKKKHVIKALYIQRSNGRIEELLPGISQLHFHRLSKGVELKINMTINDKQQEWMSYVAFKT